MFIVIAYYSDGGKPEVKFTPNAKEAMKFIREHSYHEVSAYELQADGNAELIDGKELRE